MVPALLVMVFAAPAAWAVPTLAVDMDPSTLGIQSSRSVLLGDTFHVNLVVSGLDADHPLHAFQYDLNFDSLIAGALAQADGGALLTPVFEVVNLIESGHLQYALTTLGPDATAAGGVVAELTLQALGVGTTTLDLSGVILTSPFGQQITPLDSSNGFLAVTAVEAVIPEPPALALAALGLALLSGARRRWARRHG